MKRRNLMIMGALLLATCFALTNSAWAGFPVISAQDLKSKLDSGEKLLLINPLSDIEYGQGHVPGSVNIPMQAISTTDKLPSDKDTLIVTYCLGPK